MQTQTMPVVSKQYRNILALHRAIDDADDDELSFGDKFSTIAMLALYKPVEIDDPECPTHLQAPTTPDILLERKQLYEELSDEAKEVAQLILNGPAEVLATLQRDTRIGITRHFRKISRVASKQLGLKPYRVRMALYELRQYVTQLAEY
jgi:hypothetical protein